MDNEEYIHRLASRELVDEEPRHVEPRLYFDPFVFDGSTQSVVAHPDIFRNGEEYPLRITHLIMAVHYEVDAELPTKGDARMVQRYGLRIRAHGTYYQNHQFTALPHYANVPVGTFDVTSQAQSSWKFERPFVLGNRDAFLVEAGLTVEPSSGSERVTVTFWGVGKKSRMPKILTTYKEISDTDKVAMSVDDLRNDGTEPLEVQGMTIHHAPDIETADPTGNIRNVRVRVKVAGNGTNQWWSVGPIGVAGWNSLVPAQLYGITSGSAIVHRVPGKGWLWYPNEGFTPEMEAFVTTRSDTVLLGIAGYIIVPR